MVATSSSLLLAVVALLAAPMADAHGVISKPAPKFKGKEYAGGYSAQIQLSAQPALAPDVYSGTNSWADVFGRAFQAQTKYKSLREFMLKNQDVKGRVQNSNPMTPECGFTDPDNQDPQPLPDKIEWYGGGQNHPGPCEAWCDNEVVLPYTVNCQKSFPDGKFPYDKSKCVGKNRMTFYWMATLIPWQVYIDCIRIGTGTPPAIDDSVSGFAVSASRGNSSTPASAPASAPAPAPVPAKKPTLSKETTANESSAGKPAAKCNRRRD